MVLTAGTKGINAICCKFVGPDVLGAKKRKNNPAAKTTIDTITAKRLMSSEVSVISSATS